MSSRNKYLTPEQRSQAVILSAALQEAKKAVATKSVPATQLKKHLCDLIATKSEARLDYIEFFDPQTLQPVNEVKKGTRMALAVFFGKTRLIDNAEL